MHVIIEKQFRDIVLAALERDKCSRSELARRMGVRPQMVTDYLNGRRRPGPDVMESFFAALNLEPKLSAEEKPSVVTSNA